MLNPLHDALFSSDLWATALEKFGRAAQLTVRLFDADERAVLGPVHPTPLFQLFDESGYDPGIFAECARRCIAQTDTRPTLIVSELHGLAVAGTSLMLEGRIVGAAVGGYVFAAFSQVAEIQRLAREAGIKFERLWDIARGQSPVSKGRLLIQVELLQVLGDTLLQENLRTRQYRQTAAIVESSADAIISKDLDGIVTSWNRGAERLFGYTAQEAIGQPTTILMPPDRVDEAPAILERIRHGESIEPYETVRRRKDGVLRDVLLTVSPIADASGKIIGASKIEHDITGRKQAEERLRQSEERYRSLFDSIDEGFCIIELIFDGAGKAVDFIYETVNPGFARHTGLRDVVGKRANEVIPDLEATWIEAFAQVATTGVPTRFTSESKGLQRWFNASCFPVGERTGRKVAVVFTDVTEGKRLEASLHASEVYFRKLTQNLPIGIWTSEPDSEVDFINDYWLAFTGLTLAYTKEHPEAWTASLHPEDRTRAAELAFSGTAAGEGYTSEFRFRDAKSGGYRWFVKRSIPVLDAAGNVQKRIGVCIDIDDLKRAQSALAAHAGELEEQVQERTGELRESIGELEAFSYSVSHDMRAPLRAMQGFAQLLLDKHEATLDPRSLDQLRRIDASAARLDLLINDVLTYSRLLRSEITLLPVSLHDLIRQVIATYPQLRAKGAEIAIEGPMPVVLANEASLTQVISNLLTNAVKFVVPGTEARVKVRTDEIEGDVRLWIEDNGIGMDSRDHERIWAIFTRIGRARDYDGTGIGLAIVRKAVDRMNGQIGVESALGQGSRFWVRLRKA